MSSDLRWCVGSVVHSKASTILVPADLGRRYGSLGPQLWLPGVVTHLFTQSNGSTGQNMHCLECTWYFGGGDTKSKEAAISSTKAALLDGGTVLEGANVPNAPDTQQSKATMAMDAAVAAALTAAVAASPTGSADQPTFLVLDGVEWNVNNEATLLDCNGPTPYHTWTLND